jgi:hypothetical protein
MVVYNLCCEHDHAFEGWFNSLEGFESQQSTGGVACPMCASTTVVRRPVAPRLSVTKHSAPERNAVAMSPSITPEAMWRKMMAYLRQHTEDVGSQFSEEARKIHYGETEARGIRGSASQQEVAELNEEGIDVLPLPLFPIVPDKLQ